MPFHIIKDSQLWRTEVNVFEHDFYHTWDFHYLSSLNREGSPVLFKFQDDQHTVVFPLLEREIAGEQYKDLVSVYGYPGPLFSIEDPDVQNELFNKLIGHIEELGYVSLFSRLHPLLNQTPLDNTLALGDVVYFDLNDSLDEIYAAMRNNHRRDIRKLEKSELTVQQYDQPSKGQILEFKHIYDLTMDKLGAVDYYFFDEDFYRNKLESTDYKVTLFTAYLEEQAIASAMMIQTGGFCEYHLGGTLPEFYKIHPMKLIFNSALEAMHKNGLTHFVLGGGLGSQRDSLFEFKYGFSRKTAPFSIMRKIFNPAIYQELSKKRFKTLNLSSEQQEEIGYFPLYRYSI